MMNFQKLLLALWSGSLTIALLLTGLCCMGPNELSQVRSIEEKLIPARPERVAMLTPSTSKPVNSRELTRVPAGKPNIKPASPLFFAPNYNQDDGLALDGILCSYKDLLGNLWFGTLGKGVSKWDGQNFTNYSEAQGLVGNIVRAITQDSLGNLWFATTNGVSKFDGNTFENFTSKQGLINDDVLAVMEDNSGSLWFGTTEGISRLNGKIFTSYGEKEGIKDKVVTSILQDHEQNIWFATAQGLSKFDGNGFTKLTTDDGLIHNRARSIIEDNTNKLWIATEGGVSQYDGHKFTNYTVKDGLAHNDVRSVLESKDGTIWFGTFAGLSRLRNGTFKIYNSKTGLSNDEIISLLEDETGNIWIGSKGGINKFPGEILGNFSSSQGLPEASIFDILGDSNGDLWLSADGAGAIRYDGKTFASFTKEQGLPTNSVYSLFEDKKKNIWFGSIDAGVIKYDGTHFTSFKHENGLINNFVQTGAEDSQGNLWFGTATGVSQFDGKTFTNYTEAQGLADDNVNFITEDKNKNLWFGTNGGISKFDGKSFENFTRKNGFPSSQVYHIFEDAAGTIWFSTNQGAIRYDGKAYLVYTVEDGLPDNSIVWITSGKQGQLFMGTLEGLVVFAGYKSKDKILEPQNNLQNEKLANLEPVFRSYNRKNGFPIRDANISSHHVTEDGVLWFGTGSSKSGLVLFNPNELKINRTAPKVWIKQIAIKNEIAFGRPLGAGKRKDAQHPSDDIRFDSLSQWFNTPQGLTIPYELNGLTFDILAIEPDNSQSLLYQYRMKGYQDNWTPPSSQTSINFNNIFEGTYKFEVRAKRAASEWGESTVLAFTVRPPWYRTYFAYGTYLFLVFSFFFGIYRWRTAALRKRQKQLEHLYDAAERFLPKDFLHLLNREHVEDVELGDSAEIDITIMFSDIRGFTSLAEKLGPQTTAMMLNEYMRLMAPIVRRFNGVVGQFLGDGILAFFDSKTPDAVWASLEMQKVLPSFNEFLRGHDLAPVHTGIALNAGPSIFTVTGEEKRLQATIISDDVNLASRIESLNKYYNTKILITGSVYDAISKSSEVLSIMIDKVIVVGRSSAVRLYALWPSLDDKDLLNFKKLKNAFEKGFHAYEQGDFTEAHRLFRTCLKYDLLDGAAGVLIERCLRFEQSGKPMNWDGTTTLHEK